MQRLEVSCAVRRIYTSLGAKGLNILHRPDLVKLLQFVTCPELAQKECAADGQPVISILNLVGAQR